MLIALPINPYSAVRYYCCQGCLPNLDLVRIEENIREFTDLQFHDILPTMSFIWNKIINWAIARNESTKLKFADKLIKELFPTGKLSIPIVTAKKQIGEVEYEWLLDQFGPRGKGVNAEVQEIGSFLYKISELERKLATTELSDPPIA